MDEESILKSLTKNGDGTLLNLDGLSKCGKIFFYSCVHLLLQKPPRLDLHMHTNTLDTFKFLSENENISVLREETLEILANFVDNRGSLINNKKKRVIAMINQDIESNFVNSGSKKPRNEEEEWLRAYKRQCGKHSKVKMAEILGMKAVSYTHLTLPTILLV